MDVVGVFRSLNIKLWLLPGYCCFLTTQISREHSTHINRYHAPYIAAYECSISKKKAH